MTRNDENVKLNYRTNKPARCPDRAERGGSMFQTTPPQIPEKTHRYHGELSGVGCWVTRFREYGE